MSYDKKQSWRHLANKKRDHEIDFDDKTHVQKILKENFGLNALRDIVLEIPEGGYGKVRYPDLLIKAEEPQTAIELDGQGPHGYGDEISIHERDIRREYDYKLLLPGIKLIVIYSAQTDGYDEKLVTNCFLDSGLV